MSHSTSPAVDAKPLDRSRPPVAGPAHPFHSPPFERRPLPGGGELLIAPWMSSPLVQVEIFLPAGAQFEPPELRGLASLTGGLLDEGTTRRSGGDIAHEIGQRGSTVATSAGWTFAYVATSLLRQHFDFAVDLLTELVTEPAFPQADFERALGRRKASLLQERKDAGSLADRYFFKTVYGTSPYGSMLQGDAASAERLQHQDVLDFYQQYYRGRGCNVVAIGDIDADALEAKLIERLELGTAADKLTVPTAELRPEPLPSSRVIVIDRPGSQTEVRLGHAVVDRAHPDYARLQVMNSILGGKFSSRINLNLRERHGYTYNAYTYITGRRGPGPFRLVSAIQTPSVGHAVSEVLAEIRRIQDEPVTASELDNARHYLHGSFVRQTQTQNDLVARLTLLTNFDLPSDYFETYLAALDSTTLDDVQRLAQTWLQPDHLAIVAVGPADELVPQLQGFGDVEVVEA